MVDAAATWTNADGYVRAALSELGPGRTLAFVFDRQSLLVWPEGGDAEIPDNAGNRWFVLPYRGNDMSLRARFQSGRRTAIWVRPPPGDPTATIDLTSLSDLLHLADAYLDASLAGMLTRLLPNIPLPADLADWAPRAADDPQPFARALRRVLQLHGGAVSKRHVLAASVCTARHNVSPALAWMNDSTFGNLLASYAHLLALDAAPPFRVAAAEVFRHVAALLPNAPGRRDAAVAIGKVAPDSLLDFLYALAATRRRALSDPLGGLVTHGLAAEIGPLFDRESVGTALMDAADCLNNEPEALWAVATAVERRLKPPMLRRLQALLAPAAQEWPMESVAGVRLLLLAQTVCADGDPDPAQTPPHLEPLGGAPKFVRAAQALYLVNQTLARLAAIPSSHMGTLALDALVDRYAGHLATLEYDVAAARHTLSAVNAALGEQRQLSALLDERAAAAAATVAAANRRLADLLHDDPDSLGRSPASFHRWLTNELLPQAAATGRRLWLLLFDGLRWDLWERVLWPRLEALGWTATVRAGLACLPSETFFCRTTLLAGKLPATWLSEGVSDEQSLLVDALRASSMHPSRLTFRGNADLGDEAGSTPMPGAINVWFFHTPDRLTRHADGSLVDVATQFDAFLERDVVPELSELLDPADLVFVGTDHGFLSAAGQEVVIVSAPAERVHDRYLDLVTDVGAPTGPEVSYGDHRFRIATNTTLFRPLEAQSPTPNFRHGGATLQELVIPLVELKQPARSLGVPTLTLSQPDKLEEDAAARFVARIANGSDEVVRGQLLFETNLGREGSGPVTVGSGKTHERGFEIVGREGLEWVRASLVAGHITLSTATQPVDVVLKKGIKLIGLDKLDDW